MKINYKQTINKQKNINDDVSDSNVGYNSSDDVNVMLRIEAQLIRFH